VVMAAGFVKVKVDKLTTAASPLTDTEPEKF
jgi:hypothetical protein